MSLCTQRLNSSSSVDLSLAGLACSPVSCRFQQLLQHSAPRPLTSAKFTTLELRRPLSGTTSMWYEILRTFYIPNDLLVNSFYGGFFCYFCSHFPCLRLVFIMFGTQYTLLLSVICPCVKFQCDRLSVYFDLAPCFVGRLFPSLSFLLLSIGKE